MEPTNFHKQKLYALIIAGLAFVALLLPWVKVDFFLASKSYNGFRNWGWLSLAGIAAVAALSLMGNKAQDYSPENRKYLSYSFIAIGVGALLYFIRKNHVPSGGSAELPSELIKVGFGLWLCLLAGLAGIALANGLIKTVSNER